MSIVRLGSPALARTWCTDARVGGRSLGFVPTMGALHEGHLTLVRRALLENDSVCVSVFVNPLQFDNATDLERYPRDLDVDARLLDAAGCHMVFSGELGEFFPEKAAPEEIPSVDAGPAAQGLEGEHRPGHFDGVATIVRRLFEVTGPDRAYFGAKDYQQTLVVRHVAAGMTHGPDIRVCPTSREPDGLARSSRNRLLDGAARTRARALFRALDAARAAWQAGERSAPELEALLSRELDAQGIELEYAAVRDPERWSAHARDEPLRTARALVAARVGGVRLIDNLELDEPPAEEDEA